MKLLLHRSAQTELRHAIARYESSQPMLGSDFATEVNHAFAQIARAPERWPAWKPDGRARCYVLRRFPFSIVYAIRNGVVLVVAVAHQRRKPDYWTKRLTSTAKRKRLPR